MADQKLSQLTASGALTGSELAYVVQGGNSRRTTLAAIVALASGTDLSYTASTRLLSSSTGADVTLPLFTSTLAGLVAASGGGTTNFLRADGTWAAPSASAGTDLSYDQTTRVLASSTGDDVTLPLATDALDGLQSAAHRALIAALIAAGVNVTGSTVAIPHIHGDIAGSVYIHVKNTSGAQLIKGTPVRVTGAVGDTTVLEVAAADAASAGTMPAIGILSDTLAVNGTGHAVVGGELTGLATDAYSVGQALYVAAGGGLTGTKPTSGTVQQVAIVGRVHASTGSVTVTIGALLSPNWDTAYSERLRWDGGATGLDAATGRTSLGLGTAAPLDVAAAGDASASQVVKGNDSRLSDARTPTAHTQTASTISDSTTAGRALLTAADAAAQRSSLGLGTAATGAASSAAPQDPAATAAAGTSSDLARGDHVHQFQPADLLIPLSDESTALTVSTRLTVSYWPRATVLTAIPIWMVGTAPTGAALQLDIRIGGTSIFSTLPTIAAGGTNSTTTTAAVFSTAFVSGGQTIAAGSSVTFHVLQIGSTVAGACLKVAMPSRRGS